MRRLIVFLSLSALLSSVPGAQSPTAGTLDIYVVDVEGGEATLFVAPSGESLLVDTGWPGLGGRDADRIQAVAKQAGVTRIDHLVVTHFHGDHAGGVAQLDARLPIRHFIDHGPPVGEDERAQLESYVSGVGNRPRTLAKPGDTIPIQGLNARVIASGGAVLPKAQAGPQNPLCSAFTRQGPEITKRAGDAGDGRSVSLAITYGKFRTVIMGDLNWNNEFDLMCPNNLLGEVDLYLVSHHGSDTSGSPALVHALRPRAAIMNNGPRKGGAVQTFQILAASPGLEDLWQNHYSIPGGSQHNRPDEFIANLDEGARLPDAAADAAPVHMGPANWIKVSASADGGFTITNSRTGATKRYLPRSRP